MKQIKTLEEIIGLTIERVYHVNGEEDVYLIFKDSFICMSPRSGYEGDTNIDLDTVPSGYGKVSAGIMTREEYDIEERISLRKSQEAQKQYQYEQYLRLKAEFGE